MNAHTNTQQSELKVRYKQEEDQLVLQGSGGNTNSLFLYEEHFKKTRFLSSALRIIPHVVHKQDGCSEGSLHQIFSHNQIQYLLLCILMFKLLG